MKRIYESVLLEHFRKERKMAFVAGPRQVGKTTAARTALPHALYLNWDNVEHKQIILQGPSRVFSEAGGDTLQSEKIGFFDTCGKVQRQTTEKIADDLVKELGTTYKLGLKKQSTNSEKPA